MIKIVTHDSDLLLLLGGGAVTEKVTAGRRGLFTNELSLEPGYYILIHPAVEQRPIMKETVIAHEMGHVILHKEQLEREGLVNDLTIEYEADDFAVQRVGANAFIRAMEMYYAFTSWPEVREAMERISPKIGVDGSDIEQQITVGLREVLDIRLGRVRQSV